MLTNSFFNRDAATVARSLLGKVLRVRHDNGWLAAMIVETEAYYRREKASHASLGFTKKRQALFMPAGTIYMYYAHGGDSLNVSCRGAGNAVLIKAGIPYSDEKTMPDLLARMHQLNPAKNKAKRRADQKLCAGQTLLCKSLGLKVPEWNQKNFDITQFYVEDVNYRPKKIIVTKRLGIPIGRDEHLPLRFVDHKHAIYCTKNPLTEREYENFSNASCTAVK